MTNLSAEDRLTEQQIRLFYTQALAGIGIKPLQEPESARLLFRHGGAHYALSVVDTCYLQLSIRYLGLRGAEHFIENSFAGDIDPESFLQAANQLNQLFGDVKIYIGIDHDVIFDATSYLFASPIPTRVADITLPLFDLHAAQALLNEKLIQLEIAAGEFFRRVDRRFSRSDKTPASGSVNGPPNMDGANYFALALADAGHPYLNVGTDSIPQLFASENGWTFFLKSNAKAHWHYSAAIPFVEKQRFQLDDTLSNVFAGVLNEEFVDTCNSFNSKVAGIKSFVFPDAGQVFLTMTGTVPFLQRKHVSEQLKVIWSTLLDGAKKLFGSADYEIENYRIAANKKREIAPNQLGLEWIHNSSANDFETLVGSTLSKCVTGTYGKVLTGFHITTSTEDVDLDNIVICEAGVFAIECKNYSGRITGTRNGKWKTIGKVGSRSVRATRGKNPADQAGSVAFALLNYLRKKVPTETPFVYGVVVFPDNAEFEITDVTTNKFSANAPAVFQLAALSVALQMGVATKESRKLKPLAVDLLSHAVTGS